MESAGVVITFCNILGTPLQNEYFKTALIGYIQEDNTLERLLTVFILANENLVEVLVFKCVCLKSRLAPCLQSKHAIFQHKGILPRFKNQPLSREEAMWTGHSFQNC